MLPPPCAHKTPTKASQKPHQFGGHDRLNDSFEALGTCFGSCMRVRVTSARLLGEFWASFGRVLGGCRGGGNIVPHLVYI